MAMRPTVVTYFLVLSSLFGCKDSGSPDRIADALIRQDYASIAKQLDATDLDVVCASVNALAWARSAAATPFQTKLLTDTRCGWKLRIEAAWRLAELRDTEALPEIQKMLDDPLPQVRWNSAFILGSWGAVSARPALRFCAESDEEPLGKQWCAWALCELEKVENFAKSPCPRPNMRRYETRKARPK